MRRVLLGVTGGIAAYKSCELVRLLQEKGFDVRITMTKSACEFVSKLTFEALTHAPVQTDLFGDGAFGTAHIDWARWADTFLIAPATANTIAKLSYGMADDFLSTTFLAHEGRKFIAPSMNTKMWNSAATQENLTKLQNRGVSIIDPDKGSLACGEMGPGRMAEPESILEQVLGSFETKEFLGQKALVTAGPTREYLDPIRYLSSPSTGRMGFAIAQELENRGASVTVVHGPVSPPPDASYKCISVVSAEEMADAVEKNLSVDIFIGAAAVADYTPTNTAREKIKKTDSDLRLDLGRTKDILSHVSNATNRPRTVVGFAAETTNLKENALRKLHEKNLDFIVANQVDRDEKGFAQEETSVTIFHRSGKEEEISRKTKASIANKVCDLLLKVSL